jgi:glycosyltransferase involved in cell wall biosynthesis
MNQMRHEAEGPKRAVTGTGTAGALPTVDVVIPAFNAVKWIRETLESVLGQQDVTCRVIVVDDGSTDATTEVVRCFAPRVKLLRQQREGPAAARNLGAAQGSAPYLAFLDADDVWMPTYLKRLTHLLETHSELDLAFADHYQFQDEGAVVVPSFLWQHARFQKIPRHDEGSRNSYLFDRLIGDDLVDGMFIWTGSLCIRRRAFEAAGGFNRKFTLVEDHELWLRLCRAGRTGVVLEPLVGRRLHTENSSNNELLWLECLLLLADTIEVSPHLYPPRACDLVVDRRRIYRRAARLAEAAGNTRLARHYFLRSWRLGSGRRMLVRSLLCYFPRPVRWTVLAMARQLTRLSQGVRA